ncbi:MAG: RNA polymerase sigma factor RpoD, partial [Rhodospirillales bacterium]|nr:RNA polymerase sigma factor RpoD [Rhodospirillales bacterium]
MATKPATAAEAPEKPEDSIDSPLLDSLGAGLKKLVQKGKERGYVTVNELAAALPPDDVTSEQIEDTMAMMSEMGITLVDAEDTEDGGEEKPAANGTPTDGKVAAPASGEDEEEDFGRTDDPVRMYLREMGSVELLSREGEIAIAKRIEAGQEKMIGAICEGPLTIKALLEWRDALNENRILLRDIIDLEATYGGAPGAEGAKVEGAPGAVPGQPPRPPGPRPPMPPRVAPAAVEGEAGGEAVEGVEEDDAANVPLSAMEEKLKPEVLKTLSKIAKTYGEMSKVQNRRLSTLQRGHKPSPEFERRYEHFRKKIVEMVRTIHLNNNRLEQLRDQLYEAARKLMMAEGKLLRHADAFRIRRDEFLQAYLGHELDPNWLDKVQKLPN